MICRCSDPASTAAEPSTDAQAPANPRTPVAVSVRHDNPDPATPLPSAPSTPHTPPQPLDTATPRANTWAAATTADLIRTECESIAGMLIEKNTAYGNSALDPVRIFSTADPTEQIKVRIDDKLSRLQRGNAAGEDTVLDLVGYLVLLRVAQREPARVTQKSRETPPQ